MDAEKKVTTNENPEEKPQPNDKNDNINNKVYKYYLWEKNRKPDDKVYVISKDNLLKLKNYIKYDDLKSFIKGDNQLLDKINDFYKDNKIDLKSSEENKKIKIEIKEKKDKSPNENEEEINEDVVDLIQSLGYNIENDNGEKNLDKNDTKEKENEDNKKDNEEGKKIEGRKEDKVENNGQDKKEEKDNDGKNDIENKEIKKEKEIQGEKKDENENKEVKKEDKKEEKTIDEKKEEKKEEKIIDEKKEEKKEEEKKEEVKKEEKKEDEKKDEEKEKEKEQIKEEKKEDEKKEEEKKEEMKDEKKEEGNKDDINKEKIDDKKTEIQDLKKEEINKEENKEEQSKENPKNEGQTQNAESEPGKEPLQKKEEIQNPEAQNDSTKKEVIDNKEKANPPKSKSNTEEKQEETDEHKIKENIIDYDEKEKKDSEGQTKEEKKDDKTRKKSDITDKIINNNEKEKLIKDEEKEKILLQKKRNIEKEISKESDKDSKEEEPKKDVNEIVEKKEEEKDINTDNKEIQTNEINNINNQENNNNMNNANNNNMPNPEMTLRMMQFQERMMKKYFAEHGAENSFLNNYYQNTMTENNDPDDGLPQVVNGRIKLKSDKPSLGLQNVGATCYMNATLQCLIHIKELSEQLLSAFFFNYPRENKDYAEKHKLTNQFVTLLSQVYFPKLNGNPNKYYAPYDFKNLISEINPLFAGYAANDAKDLLQCLLENMHQELKQATQVFFDYNIDQKNEQMGMQYFYNSYITQNKSPINDFLYGVNEMKTTCTICKITKYNFQCYNLLYFPLKEAKRVTVLKKKEEDKNFDEKNYILTLEDCFYHFEHIDYFTGDNQMYCSDCKKEADAEYQTVLFTTPTILSIVLNRGRANKDFKEDFKFGVDLDIKKYIHNQFFKHGKYYLIGMVVHSGESNLAGHFFAYCRMDKNAKWFCYNDAFVDEVTNIEEKLKENKPYILFYHYDNDEK